MPVRNWFIGVNMPVRNWFNGVNMQAITWSEDVINKLQNRYSIDTENLVVNKE